MPVLRDFSRFRDDTLVITQFFRVVLDLARLQSHGVLLPGGAFFEAALLASAAAAAGQQNHSTNAVVLDFSRISDDTLGSFFAWF